MPQRRALRLPCLEHQCCSGFQYKLWGQCRAILLIKCTSELYHYSRYQLGSDAIIIKPIDSVIQCGTCSLFKSAPELCCCFSRQLKRIVKLHGCPLDKLCCSTSKLIADAVISAVVKPARNLELTGRLRTGLFDKLIRQLQCSPILKLCSCRILEYIIDSFDGSGASDFQPTLKLRVCTSCQLKLTRELLKSGSRSIKPDLNVLKHAHHNHNLPPGLLFCFQISPWLFNHSSHNNNNDNCHLLHNNLLPSSNSDPFHLSRLQLAPPRSMRLPLCHHQRCKSHSARGSVPARPGAHLRRGQHPRLPHSKSPVAFGRGSHRDLSPDKPERTVPHSSTAGVCWS
ncbi:hypothetical protein NLU13_5909 [Sarocladium strictum]|uniref:Uncharacterized protein n=1 Tax=Sarocladium strictum TaxID=5046 RepID=A0AA39L6M7_SARSR|nr:hypothetical protein NLU13_5909 [Sarocladium strictum]